MTVPNDSPSIIGWSVFDQIDVKALNKALEAATGGSVVAVDLAVPDEYNSEDVAIYVGPPRPMAEIRRVEYEALLARNDVDPDDPDDADERALYHERAHAGVSDPDACPRDERCPITGPVFYVEVRGVGIIGDTLTYAQAVETLNEICDEWEADGYTVDRSWASSGNYMAARGTHPFRADRLVSVEREQDDG